MNHRKSTLLTSPVFQLMILLFSFVSADTQAQTSAAAGNHFKRGLARYSEGDFSGAIEEFTRAIQLNSNVAPTPNNRDRALITRGEPDVGVDQDQILVADSFNARAYHSRGVARSATGDLDRAIDDFSRAIRIVPRFAPAYINRGNAYQAKGEFDLAIGDYTRAIALEPGSALAYNNRGLAKRGRGDLEAALADFDKAIEVSPDLAEAYNNRGAARYAGGDVTAAMKDFDAAIRINPLYAAPYCNRGLARQERGESDRAIADFDQAVRLDSGYALAYVNRGLALLTLGREAEAARDFSMGVRLNERLQARVEPLIHELRQRQNGRHKQGFPVGQRGK
jgi:tetratricopeptide (TPR) repeat protein